MICGVGGTIRGAGKLCNYLYKLPAGNRTITLNMVDGLLERFSAPAKADLQILLKIVPSGSTPCSLGWSSSPPWPIGAGATPLRSAATASGRASCSPRY